MIILHAQLLLFIILIQFAYISGVILSVKLYLPKWKCVLLYDLIIFLIFSYSIDKTFLVFDILI